MEIIKLEHINKAYRDKQIFHDLNLEVHKGEFIGIKGKSGAGKSTLLNIMGLLEECEGNVMIEGETVSYRDTRKVRKLLKNKIGYLFQNFALIDDWSVYENLRIVLKKHNKKIGRRLILEELKKVGLEDTIDKKIFQLSGGEQQRIAVVRLILHESEIILADEPTGSLDQKNTEIVINLLKQLHNQGKTIVMVSHDENAFSGCSRVFGL